MLEVWYRRLYGENLPHVYGKRHGGSLPGQAVKPHVNVLASTCSVELIQRKTLVDFIISHANEDRRPYLQVTVLGYPLLGLLDSGSNSTLVNKEGGDILLSLGLILDTTRRMTCKVANGSTCTAVGTIRVPVCLINKVHVLDILLVPNLSSTLILGMDFWLGMDVIPDLRNDVWYFGVERCVSVNGIQAEDTLSVGQRKQLDELLEQKFAKMGLKLGFTTMAEHEIVLQPGTKPIKQRYYPVSPAKQKIIDQELQKMLDSGIIEPSKSAWSSPVVMVPKKDGTYRFCIDYRALNAVTQKDAYPLPYVSAILDRLSGAKYLSSLDIKSAYHQVGMKQTCREYTAFTVPGRGLYQFKRMPFGLTNAPATWQRLVDTVLGADLEPYVFVYLDDVIVVTPDFNTHIEILTKVLDRLIAAGLTIGREKCNFCRQSLRYLGYIVDARGLHVDPEKVSAILNLDSPKTAKEIRRFVGMAGWYRRFIPSFSELISPLNKLTHTNTRFVWTSECENSFQKIKQLLTSAPILTRPDFSKPFSLQTDASAHGIGAVLTQKFEDGEKVICFLSRSLTKLEQKYTTTERECLAVIWAVEKLRHYLEGTKFTVITDHASLLWLHRLKDPTGRLARWALRLQPFTFDIIHRRGRENIVPDFLSRSVPVSVEAVQEDLTDPIEEFKNSTDHWYKKMKERILSTPDKFPHWRVENDILYKYVQNDIPELSQEWDVWKLVVPKDKRRALIKEHHDNVRCGHLGSYKTYWRLHTKYTWPKMRYDVAKYVRSCTICAQQKPEQKRPCGLMGSRPEIDKPWQMLSIDFMGPFPRSQKGYTHLIVACDYFTKYVLMCPVRSAKANSLAAFVEQQIFLVYGVPQFLICDNGPQMRSREFQQLCRKYHTRISYTAHYNPKADPVERYNKVVKTMISSYVGDNHRKWDLHLAEIGCALRTAKSEVTGFTPFFSNFGREYVCDGREYRYLLRDQIMDVEQKTETSKRREAFLKMFQRIKRRLEAAQERNRRIYNLRRRPVTYQVGDEVWRKNKVLSDATKAIKAGLCPTFVGPFTIAKKLGSCSYELKDDAGRSIGVWHVQDLKPVSSESS